MNVALSLTYTLLLLMAIMQFEFLTNDYDANVRA